MIREWGTLNPLHGVVESMEKTMNPTASTFHCRLVLVLSAALLAPACAPSEEDVKQQIEDARACSTNNECVDVGSVCPFGCAIVVNKSQSDRISKLIHEHQNNQCAYDCRAVTGIACEARLCTAKFE